MSGMATSQVVRTLLPRRARWTRAVGRLSVAIIAVGGLTALHANGAEARGGWAVTTIDSVPTPVPGRPTDVEFTIRQHGVTPVDLDEGVSITVTSTDGAEQVFPATTTNLVGHYVAAVTFPTAGEFTWSVQQGWFATQDLGPITVGSSPSTRAYRYSAPTRYMTALAGLGFATLAIRDGLRRCRYLAAAT
jgi:hypothetical protein